MTSRDPAQGLSTAQLAAVAVLAVRADERAACEAARVSPRTLRRWRQSDDFRAAIRTAARDAHADTQARIMTSAETALTVLLSVMNDPKAASVARVRAATVVLRAALDLAEYDIADRIDILERRVNAWDVSVTGPASWRSQIASPRPPRPAVG